MNHQRALIIPIIIAITITLVTILVMRESILSIEERELQRIELRQCYDRCDGRWATLACGKLDTFDIVYDGVPYSVCRVIDPVGIVGHDVIIVFDDAYYEDDPSSQDIEPFMNPRYYLPHDHDQDRTWEL